MSEERVEAKLFKKIDNTYVEITKEQLIISLQEANKSLEQEIARLKERNQEIYDGFMVAIDEVCETDREKREYKSKIDKAIEYIKKDYYTIDMGDDVKDDILEILGSDNNV